MSKFDTYQEVTDAIVAELEAGTKPWRKEWNGSPVMMPRRATGQLYRGINVLLLWGSAEHNGFSSDRWVTFKQAIDLGGNVRKGSKGTRIIFYKTLEKTETNEAGEDELRKIPMMRTYTVFNANQCEGLPEEFAPKPAEIVAGKERDEAAEAALRSCGAVIQESPQAQAFYSPSGDYVHMPDFDLFKSTGGYLATLAHELTHWTGHKSRLDRFGKNENPSYAFEELVAEIGAAFIGAQLGIVGEHIDNHAAYVASWLKALKDDKRLIFKAAAQAQTAADLVLAKAGADFEHEPEELAEAA